MRSALVLVFLIACHSVPDAPRPIAYDHEPCTHCHMLIGDPRYAAQLVTDDGDVLDFDDPGCALTYLVEHHPSVHRLWFRDSRGDRWLSAEETAFVPGATTPMGYGLAAVSKDTPGAIAMTDAKTRVARPR